MDDADSPFGPSGDHARPVNRPTGIWLFLLTLFGVGMLFAPISQLIGHHHDTPEQDPATCELFIQNNPDVDPASINCEESK